LLKELTGYGPNDYIKPVRYFSENIFNVYSDESFFKGHYCVSVIVMQANKTLQKQINRELNSLVEKYEIDTIHFTDLFRKKQLGNKRDQFINEFTDIVSKVNLTCLAMSENRDTMLNFFNKGDIKDEIIYHNMFWLVMEELISSAKDDYVINIWKEQENNFTSQHTIDIQNKLIEGIKYIYMRYPEKYFSICKYPTIFMKKELLMSSLADLIAYSVNKIQNKIDNGIPTKKIEKEYRVLLIAIRTIFNNYNCLGSEELVSLIDNVENQ